jgi:hypothetical protein
VTTADDFNDAKATQDEMDAMGRLIKDVDGERLFAYLERRLKALDEKTRKMLGNDFLTHTNGRRAELAQLLEFAKAASRGEAQVSTPRSEGKSQPPRPLEDCRRF